MRYEDASQTGSGQVDARNDADHLAARDYGPATGNVISGAGTITGSAGLDIVGAGLGRITAIDGAGGSDTSFSGGKLSVEGQYGTLSIDARGNYSYERDAGTPAGVSDLFHYTLSTKAGATDTARLVINIGDLPKLATDATRVVPGTDGVVTLPAGVELSDIRVVGRDLVVTLPDGSTMIIVDGAIFVPQLVLGGVEVPATNLAALLIGSEPRPAAGDLAGNPQSSGGNFEVPVAPLDPGVPLGDLLPPTELYYTPPEFEEIGDIFGNDPPLIGVSSVNVSDEGVSSVSAPNPDSIGSPDTTDSATNSGVLPVSDPDGDSLTVVLGTPSVSLTSTGVAITWSVSADGHTLTGSAGANTVITIVINNAGSYTVNLLRPIDHPNGGGEQGTSFVVPVSVSDGEDVTAGGAITVTIEDDSPTITGRIGEPNLVVDDTTLGINDTEGFSGAVSISFGADGPAAANSVAYVLGATAGPSGLVDVATGEQVNLVMNGAVVEGRTATTNQLVFTVSVDGSGNVTLDQLRAVEHNNPADPIETGESAATLSADSLVTLSIVATDRDGDSASISINIGQNLQFEDDGPDGSATLITTSIDLVVDESPLGQDEGGDNDPAGRASDSSTAFAALFGAPNYGTDGAGSVAYSLALSGEGLGSGLYALQQGDVLPATGLGNDGDGIGQGDQLLLFTNLDGSVSGKLTADGPAYFTITTNAAGDVTFTQHLNVWHADDTSDDDTSSLVVAQGTLTLVQTITDRDGDSDTKAVDLSAGVFHIEDDGPEITEESSAYVDPDGDPDVLIGDFDFSIGTDELGTITTTNHEILLDAFRGQVGSGDITPDDSVFPDGIELVSADGDTEVYKIYFEYAPNPSAPLVTVANSATVTFDKDLDKYTVELTAPIQSYSTDKVQGSAIGFYNSPDNPYTGASQWEVAVANIGSDNDFFVQFTSIDANNPNPDLTDTENDGFENDDLFVGNEGFLTISSTAIGASGNVLQPGEVLDFNFYATNPAGTPGSDPSASAAGLYFLLDGPIGTTDMIVVLKLADPTDPDNYITRTLIIENGDILLTSPGGNYPALTDGNGLIIIEPGDYTNLPGVPDNYEIVGAQLLTSTEGVAGYGYEFDGAANASDATPSQVNFSAATDDNDGIKILDIGILRLISNTEALKLELDVTITDADNDTESTTLYVNQDAPVPPVVLDLDGDGAEFVGLNAGVAYDYGSGLVATAWAGADDGILVRDANGDGTVTDASEFVFGNGQTDMEALHAQYGEQLDASDADFVMFAVWNDANSNGIADAGELVSLTDAGIASLSLVSDGQSYTAANGDVVVAGTSSFTRTDGSTGDAADAAFKTGAKSTMETERIAANSNSVLLAGVLAAAGLAVSVPAAAAVDDGDIATGRISNAVVSVEAFDLSILNLSTDTAMPALMGEMRAALAGAEMPLQSAMSMDFGNGSIGDLANGHASMAPTALLEGSDMIAGQMAMPMLANDVVMPSAGALVAMAGLNTAQSSVTIETIVADALQGGGGSDINALLNALPNHGIAANGGSDSMASLGTGFVPTWDTGHGAGFTFVGFNVMSSEALVLHHDAIQPVVNG